jgi:Ca2+-binding RTX toxin-like protein
MSAANDLPDTLVFSNPAAVTTPVVVTNPASVVLPTSTSSSTPAPAVVLGGTQTITTTANTSNAPVNLVVSGANNQVNLGTGAANVTVAGGGGILEAVQVVNSQGQIVADVGKNISLGGGNPSAGGIAYNGATVNQNAIVTGSNPTVKETVAQAAGGLTPNGNAAGQGFAFYAHGGAGNDVIAGSDQNDFIRGGAGRDTIDGQAGNDLIRGGIGSDSITLGAGIDTLYYTVDQVGGNDLDTVTDFTSGVDKIAVQGSIGVFNLAGQALTSTSVVQTIVFKAGSAQTTLVSTKDAFRLSDIQFIA